MARDDPAGHGRCAPLRQRRAEDRVRERVLGRAGPRPDPPAEAIAGIEPGVGEGRQSGRDRAVRPPQAHDRRQAGRDVVRPDGGPLDLVVGRAGHRDPAERGEAVCLHDCHAGDLIGLLGERRSARERRGDQPRGQHGYQPQSSSHGSSPHALRAACILTPGSFAVHVQGLDEQVEEPQGARRPRSVLACG